MKIDKLKSISIAACCLVASLWSATQGMDNQNDILESATVNRTSTMQSSSQNEIGALDCVSASSHSWLDIITAPGKALVTGSYDFMRLAERSPRSAVYLVLATTFYVAPVAAQVFQCTYMPCYWGGNPEGCYINPNNVSNCKAPGYVLQGQDTCNKLTPLGQSWCEKYSFACNSYANCGNKICDPWKYPCGDS